MGVHRASRPVLLTGGGTLGPVIPLLALAQVWRAQDRAQTFEWVGTPSGPEREFVVGAGISFHALLAPKLDRNRRIGWLAIPFQLAVSCVQSYKLLKELQPSLVVTAGGYVSVPIVWMAWFFKIPTWVHQLDVKPGLANRLMAPFAQGVSVTWERSASAFSKRKTHVIGGLVRGAILKPPMRQAFAFLRRKPVLLVLGGGTGAASINEMMRAVARDLIEEVNVIHLTGKGKMIPELAMLGDGYLVREQLIEEMSAALHQADIVVARAGMGTIMELAALAKPTVLVPILDSHQEENADMLESYDAAVVLRNATPQQFVQTVLRLAREPRERSNLGVSIHKCIGSDGARRLLQLLTSKNKTDE